MVEALLGKIEGLLGKVEGRDFFFASFLPTLLFLLGIMLTLAGVIGFEASVAWIDGRTVAQKIVMFVLAIVGLVVFAYVLNGLRSFFIQLWGGTIEFWLFIPFLRLGEAHYRSCYIKKWRRSTSSSHKWKGVSTWFRDEVNHFWSPHRPSDLPQNEKRKLMRKVVRMHDGMRVEKVKEMLTKHVITAHQRYRADSLSAVYHEVFEKLQAWERQEQIVIATQRAQLERQFGTLGTIRATALGNIVESYNVYAFKRYRMEGEVLWPRLQYVIKPEFLATIKEARSSLDFCLNMLTLSFIFGLLTSVGGPWLWWNWPFWSILTAVAFLVSFLFYRFGVLVAGQFGDLVCASFDLFRHDLLNVLSRAHPIVLPTERQQWEQFSQLLIFGEIQPPSQQP